MQNAVSKHQLITFYLFAFAISWAAWGLMIVLNLGETMGATTYVFSTLGGLGPLLSLLLLEKLTQQEVKVGAIFSMIRVRKTDIKWFPLAIFAFPVITVFGNLAYSLIGQETQLALLKPGPAELGLLALPVMVIQFAAGLITSPLFEEPGWRGFALIDLQRRFGREIGSVIVGALWWLWHQPMNLAFGLQPSVYGFFSMLAFSFMIDSLFNLSGRNLLTAMLAHQSSAIVFTWLYAGQANLVSLVMLIGLVVALRVREWRASHMQVTVQRA